MSTNARESGLFGAIADFAGRAAVAFRRRRTAQILAELPEYIRKDIGFYRDERDPDAR